MEVALGIETCRARRAVKLLNACDLTEGEVRKLARSARLSVAELRRRAVLD